jgi:hypothetical protein
MRNLNETIVKPKNSFSKSAGFRQFIVLVGVMLAFTTTFFVLTSAAQNEDGDGKVTISGKLRLKHSVTLAFSGSFDTETNKEPNPLEGFSVAFTCKDDCLEAHKGITRREKALEVRATCYEKEIDQSTYSNAELKYHEIISQCNFDDYKNIEYPFVRKGFWGVEKFMFAEIFRDETVKSGFQHTMDVRDGSMAVLIGIIVQISIDEKRQVKISNFTDLILQRNI